MSGGGSDAGPRDGDAPRVDADRLAGAVAATFVFDQVRHDDAFEELNDRVRDLARATPGYLGRKDWRDAEGHRAVTYYFESMEALRSFASEPGHREAKRRHREWYAGYRVEISRVLRVYGGGELDDAFGVPDDGRDTMADRDLGGEGGERWTP